MNIHELFEFPNPLYEIDKDTGKVITDNLLGVMKMHNEIVETTIIELFPVLGYTFTLLKEQMFIHTFLSTTDSAYLFIADFNKNKYYLTSSTISRKIRNINSSSRRIKSTFISEDSNLLNNLYKTLSLIN